MEGITTEQLNEILTKHADLTGVITHIIGIW